MAARAGLMTRKEIPHAAIVFRQSLCIFSKLDIMRFLQEFQASESQAL